MNLKEARSLVTTGPMAVNKYCANEIKFPNGPRHRHISCPPDATGFVEAALLVHCNNRFDEVVQALERLQKAHDHHRAFGDGLDEVVKAGVNATDVLARAREVRGM